MKKLLLPELLCYVSKTDQNVERREKNKDVTELSYKSKTQKDPEP